MDPSTPVKKAAQLVEDAAEALTSSPDTVPGVPASAPAPLEEPTTPHPPAPPKPDQRAPELRTATGAEATGKPGDRHQQGSYLTTSTGVRLHDTDHSLKAGRRGPTLLQDHHLREKLMHFDHERIPERVVHARGAAAHGHIEGYGTAASICHASVFDEGRTTPVFVRFSTVLGSRGSADTVRDTRGFATKFYTDEGIWDLVGNNIPVFFIQDGIKFPDVIHAGKPHPDREIPQAQSAHDSFWDFVSLHTEAQHHTIWNMSDRGVPRSYRMMEGFGVHTFRCTNAEGGTSLVKFHWKPKLGVHSLTWEEAQMLGGIDPDFHRRDLADAIEAGSYPEWELGVQVFPDTPEQMFEGIDLLDSTKLVPEELAPVQPIGRLVLDANPTNFFAETEQVAFHTGHLVPGIDGTDDPLLQARNFSYLDTQLSRLGGPNFNQLPINRTHTPVNDMLRDGFHQHAVHAGAAPYRPNSLDGGCPFSATTDQSDPATRAFVEAAATVAEGAKVRAQPASYDDHFSQVRQFWLSLTPVEREHVVRAYTFELGKCYEEAIKVRQLRSLAQVDATLCAEVAAGLGLPAPEAPGPLPDVDPSPALSQLGGTWPLEGRMVGIVVATDTDPGLVTAVQEAVRAEGALPLVVGPHGGQVAGTTAQRTFATTRSVEFDTVVLLDAPSPAADAPHDEKTSVPGGPAAVDPRVLLLVQEAYRHAKVIAAVGNGTAVLDLAGVAPEGVGVVVGTDPAEVCTRMSAAARGHRVWERFGAVGV
ncbi:catalase [Nocardioides sp. ChNu-153]|uniref:catalase n=1 Tax=Nocardioides sp. ChNu-153 TaxID=2779364 RepID=UPI00264A9C6B|nr:catalase [Nocardioides sp. ChNu-153]MDN7119871.1 catalase [Nocardioides sp. ChNu-153]